MEQVPPKVIGKRSPRWAFWAKMLIPCKGGVKYLFRLRIIQTPIGGIYLHDIFEADGQDPHDHPWPFISIVLRGQYVERVYDLAKDPYFWDIYRVRRHKRFSVHKMNTHQAHHIIYASPRLKTLIFVGPRRRDWGFYERGKFVPWQGYEEKQGTVNIQRTLA